MSNCKYSNSHNDIHPVDDTGNISPTVEKCIKRISEKENFLDFNVDIQNISTNGGNYLADLQAINVKGKTKYGDKEINLFIKNRLVNSEIKLLPFDEIYRREALFYNELAAIYDKFQEEANVPAKEKFKAVKSYNESNSEVTILENLCKKGYQTRDRLDPISLEFAEKSVKQLAKFHALSFVLQEKEPQYFENTIKPIKIIFQVDSEWDKFMESLCDAAVSCLENPAKDRLEKCKTKIKETHKKYVETLETQAKCLCHGDYRPNNIMMIEKNGEIKDLLAVDFQMIHYGNPVTDLIYFIFTGSDQKFRRDHLDEIKELYYQTFQDFLKYFDINAQHVYPKKRFEQDYNDNLGYGLASFLILLPFLFCGENDVPDLQNGISGINTNVDNEAGKERLRGVVDDFMKWGYL